MPITMNIGFKVYLIFICSWFLHLSARYTFFGSMRIDLLLIVLMALVIVFGSKNENITREIKLSKTHRVISLLLGYIVVTLPFVEWPGTVINTGFENFLKAIVFYYFTIYFVTSEDKLKIFISVFIACQSFRILEPLYLHVTEGYWGSFASMRGGWDLMNRLSGAPNDIVNPNGLAFIILTVIPFYFFLSKESATNMIISIVFIPTSIYALLLTASRSGMLGLFVILCGILFKSKNKVIIVVLICIGSAICINFMDANSKDRYESIFSSKTKNAATAEGRNEGVKTAFIIAMRKPLFGHGLGTSLEANANFGTDDKPAHNLYAEIAQELGFAGLAIFLVLIKSIIANFKESKKTITNNLPNDCFLMRVNESMQVWLYMNLLFSLASYGLSSYEWYLFAGLSVAIRKISGSGLSSIEEQPIQD